MTRTVISGLTATLLLLFSLTAFAAEAPDFILEDTEGDLLTLSDLDIDGLLLLNFWATWCKPCKSEMPHLQALYDKYSEDGLQLIMVAEDSPKTQSKVRPYINSKGFTFQVLLDPDQEVLSLFQGSTLPYQVLIDSDGSIIETHQGYTHGDEVVLEAKIRELLKLESGDE
ncbi:TlpA family protein disulfide reductase [bacterium]|nr:TlpA family protein disulfide reductase [bacterium]MBU1650795.1 TlpA family protein disulfide reductase [bacterium]MBU1881036.1 TlpA family protein disulfide reductase [bacterium]